MKFLLRLLRYALIGLLLLIGYNSFLPPVSTLMVAEALSGGRVTRDFVPLRQISPQLVRAVLVAEDGRFCRHHGIDWKAMHGAVRQATRDADGAPGASTITMQTVKNLFLWGGRSYARKTLELPLALLLDAIWPKRLILQSYLNIAEFGPGIFGVEAAARHYFGVSAAALNARQAALLAATLPNPKRRDPRQPSGYHQRYASSIESRMGQGLQTRCLQ